MVGNGQTGGAGTTGSPTATAGTSGSGAGGTMGSAGTTGTATGMAGTSGTVTGVAGTNGLATCPTTAITPTPLRRLTKFEYANSVRNLLGVDPAPANDLPADEITDGFNNQSGVLTVSPLHAEKYVMVSEVLAKAAVANLTTLTGNCNTATRGEEACALDFAQKFGRRAFRRPTTADDQRILMAAYTAGRTGGTHAEGIEVMIRAALQSAHFLYRLEMTAPADPNAKMVPLGPYEVASRLSYLIWGSGPDDGLLDAAGAGQLATKADVAARARTMLDDPKAKVGITDFFKQWIGTSRLDITTKSPTFFPNYSDAVRNAMQLETPAFIQHVLWTGDRKLETLLTSPLAFVTSALAPTYGVTAPTGSATTPQMVMTPASQGRSGILTQAAFMAVQAHPDQTSPVLRGKFIRTNLMCQPPRPPPMDVDISLPEVGSAATARQRFANHAAPGSSCAACHQLMDPIGLAFENFDAVGAYRTTENGETIDVSGSVVGARDPGLNGDFVGVRPLAMRLAASDQVQDCVATQWFRFAAGRAEGPDDGCSLTNLQDAFAASGGDLKELVIAMTQTDAFLYRAPLSAQ